MMPIIDIILLKILLILNMSCKDIKRKIKINIIIVNVSFHIELHMK
jgi:hypothetical protein